MVVRFFIFPFLFLAPFLLAQEDEQSYINSREIVAEKVDGIVISGDHFFPPEYIMKTTQGVLFYRTATPMRYADQKQFEGSLQADLLGKAVTRSDVEACKERVKEYYLRCCNKHVRVENQTREGTPSILVLKVVEAKAGEISVKGNKWFSKDHYLRRIHTGMGESIDDSKLIADLGEINSRPWSKAEVVVNDVSPTGESNIQLVVKDKNPIHVYGGGDNRGVKVTGYGRMYAGFEWGNILHTEQMLSFCYTTSSDLHRYSSYEGSYLYPMRKGGVVFEGSLQKASFEPFNSGREVHVAGKYDIYLPQTFSITRSWDIGLDFTTTNNSYFAGETLYSPKFVTLLCLVSKYSASVEIEHGVVEGSIELGGQPLSFLPSMSESAYSLLREGADSNFLYARGSVAVDYQRKDGRLHARGMLSGQFSPSILLPGEQFGLGGKESVRGYLNHSFNADSAVALNLDVCLQPVSLFRYIANKYRHIDKLTGALFLDVAYGKNNGGEGKFLAGAGPGVRYEIAETIYASFDLGVRLPSDDELQRVQTYFSVSGSY